VNILLSIATNSWSVVISRHLVVFPTISKGLTRVIQVSHGGAGRIEACVPCTHDQRSHRLTNADH